MSFLNFLYTIIILPLESVIEFIFNFALSKLTRLGVGGAIVCVSMAVNFLALPLYNIADSLQLKERNQQKKMEPWIKHIKKAFKGDEQYMMISAFYRLNGYNPLYSLRSALSILIEIPFFIAAYHYLSNCDALVNQSFLFLQNLGESDNLIRFNNFSIHLLPVLMTAINCVSGFIYSKDAPLREKIQIYVLAAIFLVLLYNSPSGLVMYWILNNLFSLAKNVVQKYCKKPWIVAAVFIDAVFIFVSLYFMFFKPETGIKKKFVVYAGTVLVVLFPLFISLYEKCFAKIEKTFEKNQKNYFLAFLFSSLSLAILCGALLPSSMISTSPVEFSFLGDTQSPLSYVASSFFLGAGLFVFWPLAVYFMFGKKVKFALACIFPLAGISALFNAFVFRQDYGTVNITGELVSQDILTEFSPLLIAGPVLVFAAVFALIFLAEKFKKFNFITLFSFALCLGFSVLTFKNSIEIKRVFNAYKTSLNSSSENESFAEGEIKPVFNLSKNGKNVFVLFLDRGIGIFAPYIFEEFPELKEVYSGFTFFPNTVSFSDSTNKGAPPLYGGYEYTPENINLRSSELLLEKNNEALLVLPKIFSQAGWNVTNYDPQNVNYSSIEDFSIFEDLENVKALGPVKGLSERYLKEHPNVVMEGKSDSAVKVALPRFSLLQCLPPVLRITFYNGAHYYANVNVGVFNGSVLGPYSELYYLSELTDFSSDKNNYVIMHNMLPHMPSFFSPPFYTPPVEGESINWGFDCKYPYSSVYGYIDLQHYEVNAASLLLIAQWIKYLKENDCYDNTRIIIVSDHGYRDTVLYLQEGFSKNTEYAAYQPLLMFKDFDSSGEFNTDFSFMTNADTPELTLKNLGIEDKNPFTGKTLSGDKSKGFNLYNANRVEGDWNPATQTKNTQYNLYLEVGYHVSENIFDEKNWIPLKKYFSENADEKENARKAGVKVDGGK